jgi:hypothetical protein
VIVGIGFSKKKIKILGILVVLSVVLTMGKTDCSRLKSLFKLHI